MEEKRRLLIAICLCAVFFIIELAGSFFSNSLALLSDSFHMLTDVLSFVVSLSAIYLSSRKPCKRFNFGYGRVEVLGALLSIVLIYVCTGWLVLEAVDRIKSPETVDGKVMFGIALVGIFFNIILMFTFHHHHHSHQHHHDHDSSLLDHECGIDDHRHHLEDEHKQSLNVRAAILHILGDLLSSIGVLVSSAFIMFDQINKGDPHSKYLIMDPICTFIFSVFVIATTLPLLKECLVVLMESNPNIKVRDIVIELESELGICVVDFKSWLISINSPYALIIARIPTSFSSRNSPVEPPEDSSLDLGMVETTQALLSSASLYTGAKIIPSEIPKLISDIKVILGRHGIPSAQTYVIIE